MCEGDDPCNCVSELLIYRYSPRLLLAIHCPCLRHHRSLAFIHDIGESIVIPFTLHPKPLSNGKFQRNVSLKWSHNSINITQIIALEMRIYPPSIRGKPSARHIQCNDTFTCHRLSTFYIRPNVCYDRCINRLQGLLCIYNGVVELKLKPFASEYF